MKRFSTHRFGGRPEKTSRLGGMITNGLGNSDIELGELSGWKCFPHEKPRITRAELSAGIFDDLRRQIWQYYRDRCPDVDIEEWKPIWNKKPEDILAECEQGFADNPRCRETCKSEMGFRYEPRVAKEKLDHMINEYSCAPPAFCPQAGRIDVALSSYLLGIVWNPDSTLIAGIEFCHIDDIDFENATCNDIQTVNINPFGHVIDATDCGDAATLAGSTFIYGREGWDVHEETLAGQIYWSFEHLQEGGPREFRFLHPDNTGGTTHAGDAGTATPRTPELLTYPSQVPGIRGCVRGRVRTQTCPVFVRMCHAFGTRG